MKSFTEHVEAKALKLAEEAKPEELKAIEAKITEAKANDVDALEGLFSEKAVILLKIEEAKAGSKEGQEKKKDKYSQGQEANGAKGKGGKAGSQSNQEGKDSSYTPGDEVNGKKGGSEKEGKASGYSSKLESVTSSLSEGLENGEYSVDTLDLVESVLINEDYGTKYNLDDMLMMSAQMKKMVLPHANMFKSMSKVIGESAGTKLNTIFDSIKSIEEDIEDLAIEWGDKYEPEA